jgi:hypothetical protein
VNPSPAPISGTDDADLATIAGALAVLLERETALVRDMKITEIAPLQPEKQALTLRFQQALAALGTDGAAGLDGAARVAWFAAGQRLAAATMENERALRVGRAATERLVAAIVTAVKQSRNAPAGYSRRRSAPGEQPVAGIAFDHRL